MYSLGVFTMHEGAAHKNIFPPRGPLEPFRQLRYLSSCSDHRWSSRLLLRKAHDPPAPNLALLEDAEFLNFVTPRRYWMTFLPFAVVINFSDFVLHRPFDYTRSRRISLVVALMYHVPYMYLIYRLWGGWFSNPGASVVHPARVLPRSVAAVHRA